MDNENNRYGSDEQRTRKFDAVTDSGAAPRGDGVYIGERPVYRNNGGRAPYRPSDVYGRAAGGGRTPASPKAPRKKNGNSSAPAKNTGKIKKSIGNKTKEKKPKREYTPQEQAARKRRKSLVFAFFSVVICISTVCSILAISCINDILAMNRPKDKISVSVTKDMDTNKVIDTLGDKGLIKNPWFCKIAAKFLGYDDTEYLTSVYSLQPSYGLEKMLNNMSTNSVGSETVKLIFPEGYSVEQIFEKLEKFEVCSADSLRATARQMDFSEDYPFLKDIPNKEERYYVLEGYLYPDTYEFYIGENATSVIGRFLDNYQKHWTEEYAARAAELGMSMDDVVNLASVVEKEAYGTEQMYQISSVLHNRLADNTGAFAYLQCDSTSSYVAGIPETVLAGNDRIRFTKLYDTYQSVGLPAGPVCSPGDNAIKAVLYPDDTDYFYFRHDINKKIYLAETKRGHDENGEEVLRVNSAASEANG